MQSIGLILKINEITDGDIPPASSIRAKPFTINAQTTGGTEFVEISEDAAVQLRDRLTEHLKARGVA